MLLTKDYVAALAAGSLIDVSDIAESVGLPWFVAMSAALRNHAAVKGNAANLRAVIGFADIRRDAHFTVDSKGYLVYRVYFRGPCAYVRIRTLHSETGDVQVLVLLRDDEELDLRCHRSAATSFFTT